MFSLVDHYFQVFKNIFLVARRAQINPEFVSDNLRRVSSFWKTWCKFVGKRIYKAQFKGSFTLCFSHWPDRNVCVARCSVLSFYVSVHFRIISPLADCRARVTQSTCWITAFVAFTVTTTESCDLSAIRLAFVALWDMRRWRLTKTRFTILTFELWILMFQCQCQFI